MKLSEVLPAFYEGAVIYRSSLLNQDRTYYRFNGALIRNNRRVECWYLSLRGKIFDIPFQFSMNDLIADDWTIASKGEENKALRDTFNPKPLTKMEEQNDYQRC